MKYDAMDEQRAYEKTKKEFLDQSLSEFSSELKKEFVEDLKQDFHDEHNQKAYSPTSEVLEKTMYFKKHKLMTSFTKQWTKNEEQQLLELIKVLGPNWCSISKFLTHKPTDEISNHCYNLLKWTGYMISINIEANDVSLKEKLNNANVKFVEIMNPLKSDKEELLELVDAALYLVNEEGEKFIDSTKSKKNNSEQMKSEDSFQAKRFNFDLFTSNINNEDSSEDSSDES